MTDFELMGAALESEVGQGTTFWFTIPYVAVKLHCQEIKEEKIVQQVVEKNKLKILVAEDNPSNYMLFESILKKDYQLIHAWNGREAVELFKEHDPHLVLMDINMPELNGFQAVQEIRKISGTVPVIAVTVALFIGLIAGVTFKASDKKEIKHFTAFFSVEGDNIDPDNDIKQLIAEQIGAECEETWLVGQDKDDTEYEVFIDGKNVGTMKTGLGGKLSLSVELEAAGEVPVKIVEA